MKDWPIYFNQIRRLLALKECTPISPRAIDIIGDGWREGLSALIVTNLIITAQKYEYAAAEEARNAAHDD